MSALEVTVDPKPDNTVVVALKGEAGMASGDLLERELSMIVARRCPLVVVDLSGLTFVSSMAMGALLTFQKGVVRGGGRVRLAALTPTIKTAFERSRLDKSFQIFDDVPTALTQPPARRP